MASMFPDTIRSRIESVCAKAPFRLTRAKTPFSFDLQPSGESDQVFRVELESAEVIGGFNYREDRTDLATIWVARAYQADPEACYHTLVGDASSIRAAIIRDGHVTSGQYQVPDEGAGMSIQRDDGASYATLRLTIPINYELSV